MDQSQRSWRFPPQSAHLRRRPPARQLRELLYRKRGGSRPTFNDPNDRLALGILGELFKDRPVVGIHAVDLVLASARCTVSPAAAGRRSRTHRPVAPSRLRFWQRGAQNEPSAMLTRD